MPVRLRRPSPALVVAAVALFVALGGPAQAAKLIKGKHIKRGAVTSKHVADRGLKVRDLSRGAVDKLRRPPFASIGSDELRDDAVGSSELAAGAVNARALGVDTVVSNSVVDGSLRGADLSANEILTGHIVNGEVRKADIGQGAVGTSELQRDAVGSAEVIDGSLTLADLAAAQGSGAFGDLAPPLAAGDCAEVESSPATALPAGASLADDLVLAGRGAGWPAELALRAGPQDASTVTVAACNTGSTPQPVAGLEFRWIALEGAAAAAP